MRKLSHRDKIGSTHSYTRSPLYSLVRDSLSPAVSKATSGGHCFLVMLPSWSPSLQYRCLHLSLGVLLQHPASHRATKNAEV